MKRQIRLYEDVNGNRLYLMDNRESMTKDKKEAGLFPPSAYERWGQDSDLEYEELAEDEFLRLINAPMLPGFEGVQL